MLGFFRIHHLKVDFQPCLLWLDDLYQREKDVHHHKDMITFYVCARKAPSLCNMYPSPESLFQQNVIDLVVMLAIRRVPRPSPGCFARTIFIGQT